MKGLLVFVLLNAILACAFQESLAHEFLKKHHIAKRQAIFDDMEMSNDTGNQFLKTSVRFRRGGLGNEIPFDVIDEPGPIPSSEPVPQKQGGGGLFDGIGNIIHGVLGTVGNVASGAMNSVGNVFKMG